jgi:hypothetical protein
VDCSSRFGSGLHRARPFAIRAGRGLALAFCLACAALPARALLIDEIQVYTDDIREPGEFGLEVHLNTTPSGRSVPDYPGEITPAHGIRLTPEFSYGLAPGFEVGLYLPFDRNPGAGPYLAGTKLRAKWLPLHPAHDGRGWFAGANLELSDVAQRFEQARRRLELRPIIGWRSQQWLLACNPVFAKDLAGPQRSEAPDFAPSIKVGRTVAAGIQLGLEYYLDLGPVSATLPPSQQSQALFLALDVDREPWAFNLGVGRGLNDATDAWTVKAIFEIPLK